ncbi:hypothetical protein KFF47_27230 [Pseudomonas fluorescens]|nr:hypothetical protein [Pseudomonas fluorescens]
MIAQGNTSAAMHFADAVIASDLTGQQGGYLRSLKRASANLRAINCRRRRGQPAYRGYGCEARPELTDCRLCILDRKERKIRVSANGNREMFVGRIRAIESNRIETAIAKPFKFDSAPQACACFTAVNMEAR